MVRLYQLLSNAKVDLMVNEKKNMFLLVLQKRDTTCNTIREKIVGYVRSSSREATVSNIRLPPTPTHMLPKVSTSSSTNVVDGYHPPSPTLWICSWTLKEPSKLMTTYPCLTSAIRFYLWVVPSLDLELYFLCWWVPSWLLSRSIIGLVSTTTSTPYFSSCWSVSHANQTYR